MLHPKPTSKHETRISVRISVSQSVSYIAFKNLMDKIFLVKSDTDEFEV